MRAEGSLGEPSAAHDTSPSRFRRTKRVLWALVLGVAFGIAALMLVPAALGYHRYVITGDSMSGSIDRGSVVFDEEVAVSELEERDVITYDPPPSAGVEGPITHRIASIRTNRDGERRFRTVGDANEAADPWTFTLDQPTQARVAFNVPYVGFVFAALSIRLVRILLIGLPALLIAVALGVRLWREAGEELRRRQGAAAAGRIATTGFDATSPQPNVAPVPTTAAVAPAPAAAPAFAPAPVAAPAFAPAPVAAPAFAPAPAAPFARVPVAASDALAAQDAFAVSPGLAADVRRDVERLRLASDGLFENLVRLRGRLEGVRV